MPALPRSQASSPPQSRRQQRKDEIRNRIVGAALAAFARNGFDATTVEDILQAAGVSRATFYSQFAGKPDVARFLIAQMWERSTALYADFASLPDISAATIRRWLQAVFLAWEVHREGIGTMLRDLLAEVATESHERHEALVASLIGDGRHWRQFSGEEARRRAYLLIFLLERTMQAFHVEGWDDDGAALLDTLTDIWVKSLTP